MSNKEKNIYIFGDIHGVYEKLMKMLKKINYDPVNDLLIFLGDYIDRGEQSEKVLKTMKQLNKENNILLLGNHEHLAYNYARYLNEETGDEYFKKIYFRNGGKKTIENYSSKERFIEDIYWVNQLSCIHVTNNYIFVHAGLNPNRSLYSQKQKDLLWIRKKFYTHDWSGFPKVIFAGHTPVRKVSSNGKIIMLDTGCGKGGKLSVFQLNTGKIYTVE